MTRLRSDDGHDLDARPSQAPPRVRHEDAVAAVAASGTRHFRAGGGAVLVVEDDPDLQWRLARVLTVNGNRVVGTSSPDGALALMAEWPVDFVLLDENLAGIGGLALAQRIHARHPSVPVVLLTDSETQELRLAAQIAGVVAFLAKPFRPEALAELLGRLLPPVLVPAE